MKLTDENQDYMDCRPLGRESGIETPEWLEKLIAKRTERKIPDPKQPIPPATE
jgi:hypothetical protein